MKIAAKYATDETLETEGVWVEIGERARILVARAGNPKHEKLVRELRKPHERRFRDGKLPDDLATKLAVEAIARTILLGWEGLEDENGEPMPYSVEKARELLTELKDFRTEVAEIATEAEMYRKESLTEAAEALGEA